jgi:rubrerythrin
MSKGMVDTRLLKKCPEYHDVLYMDDQKDIQICNVCGYRTKKKNARLDQIICMGE